MEEQSRKSVLLDVTVASRVGGGSVFTVPLPLQAPLADGGAGRG
jgi:hypothetical protein